MRKKRSKCEHIADASMGEDIVPMNEAVHTTRKNAIGRWLRAHWIIVVAACSLLFSVFGFMLGSTIRSPQDVAASQQEPEPSLITATVTQTELVDGVDVHGTIQPEHIVELTGQGQDGAGSGQTSSGNQTHDSASSAGTSQETISSSLVVTSLPVAVGDSVGNGTVVAEISGRPLFVFHGTIPAYRDIKPDDQGPDIAQLQRALVDMGLLKEKQITSVFDSATRNVVDTLYASHGYRAERTDDGDDSALRQARAAVRAARRQLQQAQTAATCTNHDSSKGNESETDDTSCTIGDGGVISVQDATQDLVDAQDALSLLERRTGIMMPIGEISFIPSSQATVSELPVPVGANASGTVVSLSTSGTVYRASVDSAVAATIKQGMTVTFDASEMQNCSVSNISDARTASGTSTMVTVSCDRGMDAIPSNTTVDATIIRRASNGKVLTVPLSAVSKAPDGTTTVIVRKKGDRLLRIPVTTGLNANGRIEIAGTDGSSIRAGTTVVVGGKS